MKKVILSLALVSGIFSTQIFAGQDSDDEKKKTELKKFNTDCSEGMVEAGQNADVAKSLCDCVTKKIDELLTLEEVISFNEGKFENVPMEKLEKFSQMVQDCATQD